MVRRASQSRHPFAGKLSLEDAVHIRSRYATGTSARQLAAEYRVSTASIYALLRGEAHACVVAISLVDTTYEKLVAVAAATGCLLPDLAAEFVTQGLSGREAKV